MKNLISIFILLSVSTFSFSQEMQTRFETSKGTECGTYEETIDFCHQLDSKFASVSYVSFGKSSRQNELPMLIVDKDGFSDPDKIRNTGRIILMIQASIHPGEPDGTSAGLMLCRDLAENPELKGLLNNVSLLFIPILNVDGYIRRSPYNRINQNGPKEMGWRTNALNINLNRDYLRSESVELQAWHSVFNKFLPDFFIDCHTTDGADYQYVITYDLPTYGNMFEEQTSWIKESYLEPLLKKMEKAGFPMFRYIQFREWHNPKSGLTAWVSNPMLSQGYTAIKNRPGLLIETHMLKDYDIRVRGTYQTLLETMQLLQDQAETLKSLNEQADKLTASKEFRKTPLDLEWKPSDKARQVEFKGIKYKTNKSKITGETWVKYGDKKTTYKLDYYDDMYATASADIPEAYIIPPEWQSVIKRLDIHGIKYEKLTESKSFNVRILRFNNIVFAKLPSEGAQRILDFQTDTIVEKCEFPAHSVIVHTNQKNAKVIVHLLDPIAPSSMLRWGYFNAIFEQKEYAENYVMEDLVPKMLDNDPELKIEFEEFMSKHPEIKGNQWVTLNWFYQRTEYWDKQKDRYPIGMYFGE
jgi:hypothetical protein